MHIKDFVNPAALYQCPQTCKRLYVDLTFSFLTCTVLSAFQFKVRSSNVTLRGIITRVDPKKNNLKKKHKRQGERLQKAYAYYMSFNEFCLKKKNILMRGMCFGQEVFKKKK